MKHILLILLFAALLAVASCSRTDDARLAVAERQMAEHPDSALLTLRQIDATSLNRHNTALYALLLTQAQYKNDITATSDSLINIALDYFSDGKRHIECLIYKGAVLQELGEEQEAIDYLKKAEAATSPTDNEMLGYINMRLGNIYMNSYIENNEDIAKYKKALHYYKLSGNKKYQLACLGTVGALYRAENMDSAYYYINAAIKLAEELGNSERIAYHKGLLVRAYITDSLIYKAKNAATCLMAEYPEYCDNDLLLDASRIYAMLGNRDSAFFYLQKASKLNLSEPEEIVLLDAKYNIFMADKNYKAALNIVKEKNKLAYEIYNRGQQQKLYITEQKYNKTQVELDKIRIRWIAFVLAFCILLLFGVICFLLKKYRSNKLEKERLVFNLKEELIKSERDYLAQKEVLITQIEKLKRRVIDSNINTVNIDEIKNALNKPLCLIKNLIDKSHMARKPESFLKEFKELVSVARFPNGIWSELRYSVDILNHSFLSELNKEFPSLSIADLNFITLMVCKFSMVEIMICMGYTNERSAFNKRLEIAKKISVHKESLIDYILNKIENLELEKHQD